MGWIVCRVVKAVGGQVDDWISLIWMVDCLVGWIVWRVVKVVGG